MRPSCLTSRSAALPVPSAVVRIAPRAVVTAAAVASQDKAAVGWPPRFRTKVPPVAPSSPTTWVSLLIVRMSWLWTESQIARPGPGTAWTVTCTPPSGGRVSTSW